MRICTVCGALNPQDSAHRKKENRRENYNDQKNKIPHLARKNIAGSNPALGFAILNMIDYFYLPETTAKEATRSLLTLLSHIRSDTYD